MQLSSSGRILALILLAGLSCKTTSIGPPLTVPIPAGLSSEDAEVAIVAMLTAPETKPESDPNTYTLVIANPLGAMLLDRYRHGKRSKGWFVESWTPGTIHVGYQRRSYYMRVAVRTTNDAVSLRILSSRNLKQSGNRIHTSAKVWLEQFEIDIRDALGSASLLKRDFGKPTP